MNATTASEPRLTTVRNRYSTWCRDCEEWIGPDGGYLYEKVPDEHWLVQCDGCAEEARYAEKEAAREARRRAEREAEEARRRREQELRDRLAADPYYQDLLRMMRDRQWAPSCLRTLGLTLPTDAAAVKSAYRKLALRLHPDAGGDARDFVRLNDAYREALSLTGGRP